MTGRGRGRGALARWELANKTSGGVEGNSRGGFSAVFPLPKENWEDAVRKSPGDSIKSNTLARVTHIIDVEHFWAQTGSAEQLKQFDTYMIALNSWCNEQQRSSVQQVPVCGQPVCVRHTDTGQWRRAQVTRLSDSVVDVFYLDYGQSECVSFDRICNSTPGDIMSRPPLAQYITLEGVKPVGGRWSEEANSRFSELVSSKLTIHFLDNYRGKLYIRKSNGQDVSVGDVLISERFAQSSNDSDNRGPWKKEISRSMNTDQQKILEQQWNSLTSPPSHQPTWKTSNHFSTERIATNNSPFTSRGQYLQKEPVNSNFPAFGNKMFTPSQMFDNESKQNEIPLNDIPLPPNPGLRVQNRENDNLETFHIKRAEHGPAVESLRMARPHLASPSEFLSQHRQGHDPGHPHAYSAFPKCESPPKYQPPYLRNSQAKMHETSGMNTEPKLENFTSLTKNNNSAFLPQHVQQQPFSNFSFSPKQGRKQIAAQFQTNPASLGDLPPISHQPPQQTIQSWQQPEFLKTQSLSENTRDKTLKAELEWKIWKFQRNVKKVIDRIATCDVVDCSYELEKLIADSRLSQEFQGISEVAIILKLLLEKVMDKVKFANVAVRVCMIFRDMDIPELGDLLNKVLTECQQELMEQSSASDCPQRCQKFSSFLGKLYLEVQNESDATGLKSSVDSIVANSLHNWLSFDQADSVVFHSLNAACLMGFLKVTGPTIDQTEGNEISRYFGTIRNLVLSQDLAVPVKSTLLDILLLRASGWKEEDDTDEQETASLSTEDDVFLESENDVTEEEEQLETGDQDDSDEWDPYCKVKSMLKNLKLEDLLQKFFDNCIRDSLLAADWEELKRTLQEAGFPPGVILEIRMYLDKGLLEKDVKKSSKPATDKPTALPADLTVTQELKRASKSPSPTKAMEHNIEINQLNQELQQLLIGGNQDKGGQKISPAKRVSPHRELAGHDTTPYSRAGPRKFVSRAERRRSLESPQEDVSQPITDQENSGFERTVPKPSTPAEPVNTRASAETSPEEQNLATMSYSAVLKTASQEAAAKTAPAITKPNQSKTFSRPPPGFPPLPTHGGDTKMNMTVLGSKPKTKPPAPPSSAPWNNTPTRADASANWRNDGREEQFTQSNTRPTNPIPPVQSNTRSSNPPQSVQSTARPINQPPPVQSNTRPTHQPPPAQSNTRSSHGVKWRPFDVTVGQSRSPPRSGGGFSEASSQRRDAPMDTISSAESDESSEPAAQTVVHAHRAFGPGGLKACVICGSKDHLRCNDRSKMFMD